MDKLKKVLFLTYCYPPQKYPRSVQIAHLHNAIEQKFSIKIITPKSQNNNDDTLLTFTKLHNVEKAQKSYLTKFVEQARGDRIKKALLPDHAYLWHLDLLNKSIEVIDIFKPDVVITFGQPMSTHIAGLKIKKKYPGIKWFAHFSDPWVDNIFNQYNFWVAFINNYYQNKVFKICDNALFTSQETIELITKKYSSSIRKKSIYLPHIFDNSLTPKKELSEFGCFTVRYLGNFYGERKPKCLFEAIKRLPALETKNLRIELIGGSDRDISDYIKVYNLEHLVFLKKPITYLESLSLMQNTDLLLIIDASTEMSPFLPSKLIDYIGANKPIFGITPPGTAQKLIEEMGFLVAHPNNPTEIARKLGKMIKQVKSGTIKNVPKSIRDLFSSKNVGCQMTDLINKVCRSG